MSNKQILTIIIGVLLCSFDCGVIEDYFINKIESVQNENETVQLIDTEIFEMLPKDNTDPILEIKDYNNSMYNVYKMILNKYKHFDKFELLQDTINLIMWQNEKTNLDLIDILFSMT